MTSRGRQCIKMPCESCAMQFSVFKRKRICCECERYYCSACLRRGGGAMCAPCRVLSTRPLSRQTVAHLKVRDLQCFLQRQNVSTRGCVEKEELVSLCVSHVNSPAYRRRGSRANSNPFSSLKGITNNINEFINSAFCTSQPAPHTPRNCYNTAHVHTPPGDGSAPPPPTRPERFTTTPGGQSGLFVPVPEGEPSVPRSASAESVPVDTADCFEIEDLDDTGWEFVARPAAPLPNDSEVLMSATESAESRRSPPTSEQTRQEPHDERQIERDEARSRLDPVDGSRFDGVSRLEVSAPQRAASELELRPELSSRAADSASLQDEPLMDRHTGVEDTDSPKHVILDQFKQVSDLDALNVKQLKELLTRNRVEFRGCVERCELLDRAKMLWRDHAHYRDEVDNLPIEECCKICMAAPLECVLLECGHIAACTACSKQLAECPICRQYVVRAVRFFRS